MLFLEKFLDFDMVTLVRCHPTEDTIQRLKGEEGLPEKVEEQMRQDCGVCLTTKVDKIGLGNRKVDFCLAMTHDTYLKKFKGMLTIRH